jgi:catechol 2,3-dioxygenase-like lactoylglutathione lyase family enzyme
VAAVARIDSAVGDLHVGSVVINVSDVPRAVAFWCAALGYKPRDEGDDPTFAVLADPKRERVNVSVQLTDHPPREPGRLHLDLYTDEQSRHVERLIGLGATRASDWPYPEDADFVVLRDPDGNEFCVIDRS